MTRRLESFFPRRVAAMVVVLLLFGCGGGGGGAGMPQPNRPPSFASPPTASTAENSSGTIYQASATDADGNPLTFSLSGGADLAAFAITAGGSLSFVQPPDFEFPTDADANNVYLVQISVSDGLTSAVLDLSVTVTNVGPDSFQVRRVGTGFNQPLYTAAVPDNSGRMFVVERTGLVRILTPATGAVAAAPFLDLTGQVSLQGERGLLGFAAAPDYTASGTFYVFLTNNVDGAIEVRRYRTLAGDPNRADPTSADIVLTFAHPDFNHNGGWLEFGPDGFLYVSTGDGGGFGDPPNNAQNRDVPYGKILRIDVRSDAFPADPLRDYAIPAGNPFAQAGGLPEIWAYGLRNPFRASFDPLTQNLWIGDVGQNTREEIDLMRPTDGGANFGWRILEGTAVFNGTPIAGLTPPVAEYLHDPGPGGNSVTGGHVYRGPVESLRGQYFFGDFQRGTIWSFPIARVSLGSTLQRSQFILRNADFAPDQGSIAFVSSFGVDQAGNLYIVDFVGGEIFRVEVG